MNIDNLNKLIAHLEALPPSAINMGWVSKTERGEGCIHCHARDIFQTGVVALHIDSRFHVSITQPDEWVEEQDGVRRYPAHRVIATLKRLRDTYLSTGQVVVDWGPEPGEEPKQVWTAPQVAEVINSALPAELTSLLRNTVEA